MSSSQTVLATKLAFGGQWQPPSSLFPEGSLLLFTHFRAECSQRDCDALQFPQCQTYFLKCRSELVPHGSPPRLLFLRQSPNSPGRHSRYFRTCPYLLSPAYFTLHYSSLGTFSNVEWSLPLLCLNNSCCQMSLLRNFPVLLCSTLARLPLLAPSNLGQIVGHTSYSFSS